MEATGAPMARLDLDARQKGFGNVAFTPEAAASPMPSALEGRRVLQLASHESGWLVGHRVPLEYTQALRDEQQSLARRATAPAATITARGRIAADSVRFELTVAEHGYEGELHLLPASVNVTAEIQLWHGRRPLGEITAPSSWPAVIALEAPELTPNRAESAPIDTPAVARLRARALERVRGA